MHVTGLLYCAGKGRQHAAFVQMQRAPLGGGGGSHTPQDNPVICTLIPKKVTKSVAITLLN